MIFEWLRIFRKLVKIAAVHHVPGCERVTQIVKAKVFDSLFQADPRNFLPPRNTRVRWRMYTVDEWTTFEAESANYWEFPTC